MKQHENQGPGPGNRFRSGPPIPGHLVQDNEERHAYVIDHVLVLCSETEYRCLHVLLEAVDRCVPFATLLACFPEAASSDLKQERMRLAHVMSTLRARLWPLGFDIGSVMAIGYILLSGVQRSASAPPLNAPREASKHP